MNKDLLCSIGNSIQFLVMSCNGKESEKKYIYVCKKKIIKLSTTISSTAMWIFDSFSTQVHFKNPA